MSSLSMRKGATMNKELTQRVARGMAHLDSESPGWQKFAIDVLMSPNGCEAMSYIVALGGITRARKVYGTKGLEWSIRMGLCADPYAWFGPTVTPQLLDSAWRRALTVWVAK